MLSRIDIRNFQSLHDVSVELKPFTVIVGRSSSGKSAFTRALKTLTGNQRGEAFITHGETQTIIKAVTDKGVVALMRGKKNEYVVVANDDGTPKVYTKLNGTTPDEVTDFIGIPAKDPLNYSNQFDMPYLLTASAAEVARTLGDLTNVSVIFEASREANRRRLAASSTLKTRALDYADLTKNLDRYRTLQDDTAKVTEAEEAYYRAVTAQENITTLTYILDRIESIPEVPAKKELPTSQVAGIETLIERVQLLEGITNRITNADEEFNSLTVDLTGIHGRVQNAEKDYTKALVTMGTCPTCGQDTHGIH